MHGIGFSTGSLPKSDVRGALRLLESTASSAIELSALRTHELGPLVHAIPRLALERYDHVSVHAPSAFDARQEPDITSALLPLAERGWLIVLHPDAIYDFALWAPFADRLCIENMDRRKRVGRTVEELQPVFARLPRASFCFDVAHAWQCDPSMGEALRLLDAFGDRLAEVHVSELDTHSRHVRLSSAGVWACQRVADLIPLEVPVIIEAPVRPNEISAELEASLEALGRLVSVPCAA
jgi:sugar phosphate isomerase/epimerase